ncbi:Na+/H+ antiporter subunit E [Chitinispirillales bacterium ANBcel5]|uniref:Na+/H+ antiporter subunit E n=1 Tax=Cellulosispirillum alkaliphilum TaxID=3039283 RepID=UPI002A519884|nr:Na+/H+ antiporter subunit E [Chitinispirillales bacterium ANBcel5]
MNTYSKWKIVRIILTSINLFIGWLLFSGSLELEMVFTGIILSVLVSYLTYDIFIHDTEAAKRSLLPKVHLFFIFLLIVLFKMYVASFKVTYNVLRGRINPRIVHFRTKLKADLSRVILTNAITVTPGTITLNLDDDHLIVHWLDAKTTHSKYSGELIKGTFERLLKRIWI